MASGGHPIDAPPTRGAADPAAPDLAHASATPAASTLFRLIERFLLLVVAAMTVTAAGVEVWAVYLSRSIDLADILLMFLYTEVMGMIAVFYAGRGALFVYPIFIAITALARLIVLQGKDMAPENILYEAGAILLLSVAAVTLMRAGRL